MSGSKRCKTKAGRRPQNITDRRVTEMIELAVILTNHPATDEAKAALARIANEVLKKGADATIDQAIEAAPSRAIAQTLRHAVETASERVVIYRNGVRTELLLFAIPIITTFEQNVPESQFESALSGLYGLKMILPTALKTAGSSLRRSCCCQSFSGWTTSTPCHCLSCESVGSILARLR